MLITYLMNFRRKKTQKRLINILAGDAVKDMDIISVSLRMCKNNLSLGLLSLGLTSRYL